MSCSLLQSNMAATRKKVAPKNEETSDSGSESEEQDDFTLDDVLKLGGNKGDYNTLRMIDETQDVLELPQDEGSDVEPDEIKAMIQKLGLDKLKAPSEKWEEKEELPETSSHEEEDEDRLTTETPADTADVQVSEVSSSSQTQEQKKPLGKFIIAPGERWYQTEFPTDPTTWPTVNPAKAEQLKREAAKLFEQEVKQHNQLKNKKKSSDFGWLKTVATAGTLADRVAGLTVLIQDAPLHNLASLDTLVSMAKKKMRREATQAVDTLKELWLSDLLPDRKLKTFEQHPLSVLPEITGGNQEGRRRRLIMWYYEDRVKQLYAEFISAIQTLAHDTVETNKSKALGTVLELLSNKPEQEKVLLELLVNKVGDPDYKIASKAAHLLGKLVTIHPNMRLVVVREVERLLYRPNVSDKAQYYSMCFLNQLVLDHDSSELANKLVTIYFSFFKVYVQKKEKDTKMLSALLTGVNRAFPYANVKDEKVDTQINELFKVVHAVNFNISVQALMLLYQVMDSRQAVSDRYYTALYRKLSDPELKHSSRQAMFLNLLYKSVKSDVTFRRVKAFIKRILQVCCGQQPSFVCGALFLVSEIAKVHPGLRTVTLATEESDDEEHFEDVELPDEEAAVEDGEQDEVKTESTEEQKEEVTVPSQPGASWVHRLGKGKVTSSQYDPQGRNPLYCGADGSCLWELCKLANHFHPSVALFAKKILDGEVIQYSGDPLQDFTLARFLDRFVFRNPKQRKQDPGQSVMQPKSTRFEPRGVKRFPVNSEEFLQTEEQKIPVDEVFFHRFFSKRAEFGRKATDGDNDSDIESVGDEEFDRILDKFEGDEEDEDLGMDFASELTRNKRKGKKKGEEEESDDDDDDMMEEDDLDDDDDDDDGEAWGEEEEEEDGEEAGVFMDPAEEDMFAAAPDGSDEEFSYDDMDEMSFSEEENDDEVEAAGPAKQGGKKAAKKRKAGGDGDDDDDDEGVDFVAAMATKPKRKRRRGKLPGVGSGSMFAAAEEFSSLLDDNAGSKFDNIGIGALSNKDNADAKQLKWEVARDQWVRGQNWKDKKRTRGKGAPGKGRGKKQGSKQGKRRR
ncbi:PREDICTED: CCAAT/enhancer-binding protein zeta-like [Branchiostoma belcheri]|uniref:CCAAT/enhancer-binding protein zeta n=1 Tax=Branchiostoma belcheri TaxID=7741 RepID=A0A6P4ZNA0_BRABE|nr:PREDICTED: CCAAT/enhancer-binding protein zeta-like [Branchiostoma belcheri]